MKKLLIAFLFFISNQSFAITDQEIADRSGKQFLSCLNSGKNNLNCLDEYKQQIYQMTNVNGRAAGLNFVNGLYELFVKLNRGVFKNAEDARIEYNRLETTYNREYEAGQRQTEPVYIQQDNSTQRAFENVNRLLNPPVAPVVQPPRIPQPTTLNRNCGNIINQNGSYGGYITCN